MKQDIERSEQIERFLSNQMDAGETSAFESQVQQSPELAQELAQHRMLHELVMDAGLINIKKELQNIHKNAQDKTTAPARVNHVVYIVSGVITLGLALFLLWPQKQSPSPVNTLPTSATTEQAQTSTPLNTAPAPTRPLVATAANNTAHVIAVSNKTTENKNTAPNALLVTKSALVVSPNEPGPSLLIDSSPNAETAATAPTITSDPIAEKPAIEHVPVITQAEPSFDCEGTAIYFDVEALASCSEKNTGQLVLDNMYGGTEPYQILINGKACTAGKDLTELPAGNYEIKLCDKLNCCSEPTVVEIEEKECPVDFAFSPYLNEHWDVPVNQGANAVLTVYGKGGGIMYTAELPDGGEHQWYGTTNNGMQLPMGVYVYKITYVDGTYQTGSITILK